MTIIYSNDQAVTLFKSDQQTGYRYTKHPVQSAEQVVQLVKQTLIDHKAQPFTADIKDLQTLMSCLAVLAEEMVWQFKVLDQSNEYLKDRCTNLEQELLFFHTELCNIKDELQTVIEDQTTKCLSKRADSDQLLKINLGSGGYAIEGWLNLDLSSADVGYNVMWGLPFQDSSTELIYSSYLLEHIGYKQQALKLLQEVRRVLIPGGVLRVAVPHIKPFMMAYINDDQTFFNDVETKWGFSFGGTLLEKVLNYAGVGHKPGTVDDHKFGYDDHTFSELLKEAGFSKVYPCSYMNSINPALRVDLEPLLAEGYQDFSLSLIYEAIC